MLFSQPELAGYLNDNFECAWQSMRPVPHVEIDFGNGTKLERTLSGNIATWFCAGDGRVLDVLPGLVGPAEYRRRADEALALVERLWPSAGPGMQAGRWNPKPLEEGDLSRDTRGTADLRVRATVALFHEQRRGPYLIGEPVSEDGVVLDFSKFRVENEIKEQMVVPEQALLPASSSDVELAADTDYNQRYRYTKAHALLAERPLERPDELALALFRDVLDVDLEDPYLGLAPYVLGGERGRSH